MSPIVDPILTYAERYPNKPALIASGRTIPYSETAHRLTHFVTSGIPTGDLGLTIQDTDSVIERVLDTLGRLALGAPLIGGTSGSTGAPKQYQRSQASWAVSFSLEDSIFGISESDRILAHGDPSQSLFFYAICSGLTKGATILVSDRFRADHAIAAADANVATVVYGVPSQFRSMVRLKAKPKLNQIRLVLSSGARFSSEDLSGLTSLFPKAEIIDFYGSSEASFISVAQLSSDGMLPSGSVGRPFPGVQIKIQEGQIWVNSPMLFDRYLQGSPASFREFIDDSGTRWISTGDLGYLDEDGYLFLSGRADRTINVSGIKIQPEEIEAALFEYPGLHQAAIVGLPDALRGQRVVAAFAASSDIRPERLRAYLRRRLGDRKAPKEFFRLADWPLTPGGKTDLSALERLLATKMMDTSVRAHE